MGVMSYLECVHRQRPGTVFGGDRKNFRRPRFLNEVFLGKIFTFSCPKFLMTFFHIFAACNFVYDPFFTRKTPISENNSLLTLFLLCSCFRTHPTNATSQNIGGRADAWAVPHLTFWEDRPPSLPLSLRP